VPQTASCNLCSMLKAQEAMRLLFDGLNPPRRQHAPLPDICPDYSAPIIRNGTLGWEPVMVRWSMPTPCLGRPFNKVPGPAAMSFGDSLHRPHRTLQPIAVPRSGCAR